MKNKLYLSLLVVAPFAAIAQPTVNHAMDYSAGATVKNVRCTDIGPGNAGASQTWDFSGLTPLPAGQDTARYWYTAPTSAAPVAGATLLERNSDSFYIYYKKSAGQDEVVAIADSSAANQNLTVKYTNSVLALKRPLTFGMNYTDDFTEQYSITVMGTPLTLKGRGTISVKVDGYGTLKVPGGTVYNDVLRVEVIQHQSDTVQILGNVATFDATRYMWFDNNHISPLMRIDAVDITSDALNSSTSYTEYLNKEHDPNTVAGLNKPTLALQGTFINNDIQLSGAFETGKEYAVAVYNLSGQVIYNHTFKAAGSKQMLQLNNDIPAGLYLVSVNETANPQASNVVKLNKL